MRRRRLDEELVAQGFFASSSDAMRSVLAGEVSTSNRRFSSAGEQVLPGIELHVKGRGKFVGRGGIKLEHGLEAFGIDPEGLACLDVGCSTGGFTDCLLQHNAASVVSVDVGYAQFDWSLRRDKRVRLMERTNIIDVPSLVGSSWADLAVCDVSFTSVLTVAPAIHQLLVDGGSLLTLVKPQFEVARTEVEEGGVVRSDDARINALNRVCNGLVDSGFEIVGTCDSPIRGRKGNREYLAFAHKR